MPEALDITLTVPADGMVVPFVVSSAVRARLRLRPTPLPPAAVLIVPPI